MLLLLPLLLHVHIEVNLEWHKHGATSIDIDGVNATGLGGLQPTGSGIGFLSDRYNSPISALQLGTGGNVQASGAALQAVLPAPGAAASISANVLCTLPPASTANMTALEWAAPSAPDSGARLALTVTGIANSPALVGTASTPVPSSAGLSLPKQGVFDAAGNFYCVWGNYIGVVSPAGVYTTLLGSGTAARVDGAVRAGAEAGPARLAPYAEVWEKIAASAREVEAYNLDRRPLIMSIFADLAAATRTARS